MNKPVPQVRTKCKNGNMFPFSRGICERLRERWGRLKICRGTRDLDGSCVGHHERAGFADPDGDAVEGLVRRKGGLGYAGCKGFNSLVGGGYYELVGKVSPARGAGGVRDVRLTPAQPMRESRTHQQKEWYPGRASIQGLHVISAFRRAPKDEAQ